MVILDTANEKEYKGNRSNIKILMGSVEFDTALIRDLKIEPSVFKKKFLENKLVGKAKSLSKGLIKLMKDKGQFLKGQSRRLSNSKIMNKLKENMPAKPTCKDIMTVLLADQLIYEDKDDYEKIEPDSKNIKNYIKNEDKNKLMNGLQNILSGLSQINAPAIEPCQKVRAIEDDSVACIKSEHEVYDKPPGYEDKKIMSRNYVKLVLKGYLDSLGRVPDRKKNETLIGMLESKINLIKDFQRKDHDGCYNPYEGFEKDILTADPDGLPEEKKVSCDYNMGKDWKGLVFGAGCYPQRYSCMDNKQKSKLAALNRNNKFINEDPNDDKNSLKFWVYDKKGVQAKEAYTRNYSYKKGDNYNIEGMDVERTKFNIVYEQRGLLSKVKEGMSSNPNYYMETNKNGNKFYEELNIDKLLSGDLQFQNPRYPHFRPTDQCSSPIQGDGGVCFQAACKQHDMCFQTLPNTTGESMEDRFNRCNSSFKKNISALCDAHAKKGIWGTLKKTRCHATKELFYYAVNDAE